MSVRFSAANQVLTSTAGLPSSTYTVTMWVYEVNNRASYSSYYDMPSTTGASAATWQYAGAGANGTSIIYAHSPSVETAGFATTIGNWYRVAVVSNGTAVTLYRAAATGTIGTDTATVTALTPAKLWIGGDSYPGEWFDGRIGAFKMWNAALNATEVAAEFTAYAPQRTANIVRCHTFQTNTTDTSGNGNTLTAGAGAVTFEADPPISSTPVSGSDSGTGANSGAVSATATATDTGTGSDSGGISLAFAATDTGTGSEAWLISIPVTGLEPGSGDDSAWSSTATLTGTDTGTGVDGSTLTAAVTSSDTGTGSESGIIQVAATDTATGSETHSETAQVAGLNPGTGADGGFYDTAYADLNMSVWAVDRTTGALAPLPEFQSLTVSPVRNAPGALRVIYPSTGANYQLLHNNIDSDCDLEVEVWLSGSNAGALRGYLQEASIDDTAEPPVATFVGSFLEIRMSEAVVFPQVPPLGNDKKEALFSAATAGTIMSTFLTQAQARGSLTDITKDFTGTVDSRGVAWPSVVTAKFSPNTTYASVLDTLVKLGLCEWWITADHVLHMVASGARGNDRTVGTKPVILRRGRNITGSPRKHSVRASATAVLAAGSEGVYQSASDASALSRRGRRVETSASATNISDTSAVLGFAQTELAAVSPGLMEITHGLGFFPGEPRPGLVFGIGDWIYSDTNNTLTRLRVAQWTLTMGGSADATPDGSVTLNDLSSDAVAALQRKLANMANGSAVVGTSTSSADTSIPTPPTSLTAASVAYIDGTLGARAAVTVGWTVPTVNIDGTTIGDLAGYNIQYALATSPTVWNAGITVNSGSAIGGTFAAPAGTAISIQVNAFDQSGNTSAWSSPLAHTTAADVTAPSTPSTPTVSDFLGTVRINWDGLTSTGASMVTAAPDFDHVDVHLSTGSLFTPSSATLVGRLFARGTFNVTDLPYNVVQYARLVAIDGSGNASGASGQGSATPTQVVNGDLGDGSVSTAKIQNLAVGDAQIGSASVGKLTTGTFTADMTLSGIIKTASSGNRTELDNAGIRLYNGTNVVVNLKTSDGSALVVGEFRTSLTGQRIVFNPGGALADTMNFYPSAAGDFARIMARTAPADGTAAILIDGGAANGTARGRIGAYKGEAFISNVTNDAGGDTTTGFSTTAVSCGPNIINFWARTQLYFWRVNSSNTEISGSRFGLFWADGSAGSAATPTLSANNAGVKFDTDFVCITTGTGNSFGAVKATAFTVASGAAAKQDIELLEDHIDPLRVVRAARGRQFRYRADVADHGVKARHRWGVLAEEMPAELVHMSPTADGTGMEKSLDLAGWAGLQHAALIRLADTTDDRVSALEARLAALESRDA